MLSNNDLIQLCKYCELDNKYCTEQVSSREQSEVESILPMLAESELTALMKLRSARDVIALNFLAFGRYDHFIPAIISNRKYRLADDLAGQTSCITIQTEKTRSEVEKQLATLTGMPSCFVLNSDCSSVLAHLLSFTLTDYSGSDSQSRSTILISATVSSEIRNALQTQLKFQSIDLVVVDYEKESGCLTPKQLERFADDPIAGIILAWPNVFGLLEDVSSLSNWAKKKGSLVIGLTSPLSLALLKSPFNETETQFDYLSGDLQSMGSSVGQYGNTGSFLASGKQLEGALNDYVQAQLNPYQLSVIQSYLSFPGLTGLYHSARQSNEMLSQLVEKLSVIEGVSSLFSMTSVNECVIQLAQIDVEKALKILAGHNMVLGLYLHNDYPELENCLLIHCSDQHTRDEIDKLVSKVAIVVKNLSTAGCPVKPKFNN